MYQDLALREEGHRGNLVDMRHPRILGGRIEWASITLKLSPAQVLEAICNPVDVLLDRHHHVGEYGGAARAGDGEEIWEAGDHEPQIGARSLGPLLFQFRSGPAAYVDAEQGTGHRVEARCEHNTVERVLGVPRLHTPRGDLLDRGRLTSTRVTLSRLNVS